MGFLTVHYKPPRRADNRQVFCGEFKWIKFHGTCLYETLDSRKEFHLLLKASNGKEKCTIITRISFSQGPYFLDSFWPKMDKLP